MTHIDIHERDFDCNTYKIPADIYVSCIDITLLNQVHAGRSMPGFLKLFLCGHLYACVCVFAYVCPPPRLLITSGMMWCDIDPI